MGDNGAGRIRLRIGSPCVGIGTRVRDLRRNGLLLEWSAFSKVREMKRWEADTLVRAEHVSIRGREAGLYRPVFGVGEGEIAAGACDGLAELHHAVHARRRCRHDQNDSVREAIVGGVDALIEALCIEFEFMTYRSARVVAGERLGCPVDLHAENEAPSIAGFDGEGFAVGNERGRR